MSRIGKEPISVPAGVTVAISGRDFSVKGPKGELSFSAPDFISVAQEDGQLIVARENESKQARSMHGTVRSILSNMIAGVKDGYKKELVIEGVGYKAQMQGKDVVLALGFSHDINYIVPDGITILVEGGTSVSIEGCDKQMVGQVAARIRGFSPAEPYKGKGVRYKGERIRRKEGKAVA
ncbi:MAG: 50S ribosomal protein L6 [Kiritimatiellales bacterium]|nr:50S ribosomal protein L6 [Kiritimatiellales bacterium]